MAMTDRPIPTGLRATLLLHAGLAGLVGLQHLLAPRIWTDLAGMEVQETVTWRLLGAVLAALAVGSWLGWRSRRWSEVRVLVAVETIWSVVGAAVIVWGILVEDLAALEWLNAGLLGLFGTAFGAYWWTGGRALARSGAREAVGKRRRDGDDREPTM